MPSAGQDAAAKPTQTANHESFFLGVDVGSTTVKVVACSQQESELLFQSYQRHESRQGETLLSALQQAESTLPITPANTRLFVTGSGGAHLAQILGGKFVQEVTAVSLAVERNHPSVRSVVELGGQDSKIIAFRESLLPGHLKKFASMNDKCAGGTGAVVERIAAKLSLSPEQLAQVHYDGIELHPVAGKCGVFAETDIVGLQKQGVPPEQIMASLFDAIVLQNLSVLTRGHLLKPQLLLLGGPNYFFPGLREAWRHHLHRLWRQEKVALPPGLNPEDLIYVPEHAQFFGAIGAIEYGRAESGTGEYSGSVTLAHALSDRHGVRNPDSSGPSLCSSDSEMHEFLSRYNTPRPVAPRLNARTVQVFLGIDGGSTSTKAVCLSPAGDVLASAYRLSQADPIADAIAVLLELRQQFAQQQVRIEVLGAATTGYSRDLLQRVFHADAALVETVAHAKSALRVREDVDAIIDVGGQDIKIIVLKNGAVKDFRLNTQCSAGNGYFLQAAAESIGIAVDDFARVAFTARKMPVFSYGCAVFLQSDIVNFQRQGWRPEEIIAGLAAVLPKNIFLYVAGVSNIAKLGRRFLLQGGTQRNLAVVKAEIDFMRTHFFEVGQPEIFLHPHCGEAGAIGAALHIMEQHAEGAHSSFVGFDGVEHTCYTTTRNEQTRCNFCSNHCARTFIDVGDAVAAAQESAAPMRRIILAGCERGESPNAQTARRFDAAMAAIRQQAPNIPAIAAKRAFQLPHVDSVAGSAPRIAFLPSSRRRIRLRQGRSSIRIGIPKVLNLYAYGPLFTAYLLSLGIQPANIVFSDTTTLEQFRSTLGLAAVDPCFPSKVCIPHVRNLLHKSSLAKLDFIFFPMFDTLTTPLTDCRGSNACPAGAATPEAVHSAFSLSRSLLEEHEIEYLHPLVNLADRKLFALQMFDCWRKFLGLDWEENTRAVSAAYEAQEGFEKNLRQDSRTLLDRIESEQRIGLVLLGRPYHHDPGLNHGILDSLQQLGYPIFSQTFLPLDPDLLERLFGPEVAMGLVPSALSVADVWKNSTSASSNHKIWAAKFAARHPNLIPIELSNFKCGHDAFVSRVIEQIIECSGKPHFCFRDLDENKPTASLRIRIETIDYFLRQYGKKLALLRNNAEAPWSDAPVTTPSHFSTVDCKGQGNHAVDF